MIKLSTHALVAAALLLLAGCGGDSTGPAIVEKPASDLHFLRLSTSAPPVEATVVSFVAKKGEDREVRVRFRNGEDYLRFRVFANSLLQRPDGSAFAIGDSIQITITITNTPTQRLTPTIAAPDDPVHLKGGVCPARLAQPGQGQPE